MSCNVEETPSTARSERRIGEGTSRIPAEAASEAKLGPWGLRDVEVCDTIKIQGVLLAGDFRQHDFYMTRQHAHNPGMEESEGRVTHRASHRAWRRFPAPLIIGGEAAFLLVDDLEHGDDPLPVLSPGGSVRSFDAAEDGTQEQISRVKPSAEVDFELVESSVFGAVLNVDEPRMSRGLSKKGVLRRNANQIGCTLLCGTAQRMRRMVRLCRTCAQPSRTGVALVLPIRQGTGLRPKLPPFPIVYEKRCAFGVQDLVGFRNYSPADRLRQTESIADPLLAGGDVRLRT
eukprot:scaffold1638_cov258-Pinguiococcus_pyrenoidosus.AAC.79